MEGLQIAFALCGIMALIMFPIIRWEENRKLAIACIVIDFVLFASFLQYLYDRQQDTPCVKYETSMQFNAATKTVMPLRVCVERGEWVYGGE